MLSNGYGCVIVGFQYKRIKKIEQPVSLEELGIEDK